MERRPGFVGPFLLLSTGIILLFNNLGMLPWEIWGTLWRYWPVILILFGIQVLSRQAGSFIMYAIGVLLCILLIAGTVVLAWNGYPEPDYGNDGQGAILNNSHLEKKDFNFADLDDADLSNSVLNGTDMNFANMENANFSNSSLRGANMNFADLERSKFVNADLGGANINFANLKNSDLSNADLDGANINFVNLEGANMTGASMEGANRRYARTSKTTICPDARYGPCW